MVTLSPAFCRRRVSAIVRYSIVTTFLLCWFYYLKLNDRPSSPLPVQDYVPPTPFDSFVVPGDTPVSDVLPPISGSGDDDPSSSDHSDGQHLNVKVKTDGEPADSRADSDRPKKDAKQHPIDTLIAEADTLFDQLLAKESKTVGAAAEAYRARRGRHPPPGFDAWYHFAVKNDALIIEDFFDQIYHDLEPFWALDPALMRKEAAAFDQNITVRDGFANTTSSWFWTEIWLDLVASIQHLLPDMDIALNPMDEPRIVVPWEEMTKYMRRAERTRTMPRPQDVTTTFQRLPPPGELEPGVEVRRKQWDKTSMYTLFSSLIFFSRFSVFFFSFFFSCQCCCYCCCCCCF